MTEKAPPGEISNLTDKLASLRESKEATKRAAQSIDQSEKLPEIALLTALQKARIAKTDQS